MKKSLLVFGLLAFFSAFAAPAPKVAVVAQEPGYYTALSKHIVRWLGGQKIAAALATPATLGKSLANAKLAFLVGCDDPGESEMRTLADYCRRGGKLVVFYSASPKLAALMGVKVLGYKAADYPGQWSRMDFRVTFPEGTPAAIRQTSTVLKRAVPLKGKGRIMATWSDRTGRNTGDAAWISTAHGYWMTHILTADGDEDLKARFLGALTGAVAPELWSYAAYKARQAKEVAETRRLALAQKPRAGEIHAVWDHSGCGLYPGDWPRTIRLLKESHVTDLFVNVGGAGFAHYASDVLPRSKTFDQEGDQLKACLAAAKGSGIRVHAWLLCFNATRATPARLEIFRKKGWRLKTADGKLSEYLDPSNEEVRKYLLRAISEIRGRYAVQGIHLDFVRWYERSARPANAALYISKFVAEARLMVRRPVWLTTAVLGKYPSCVAAVGQDWDAWLRANLVDYAVPMDYAESTSQFVSYLRQHAANRSHARKILVGIGVTANESRLSARQVIEQLSLVRRYGLPGAALFDLDATLEKNILPYLKMGIW